MNHGRSRNVEGALELKQADLRIDVVERSFGSAFLTESCRY